MSHKNTNGHKDAVSAWNDDLRQYGPKPPEARAYMIQIITIWKHHLKIKVMGQS